MWQNLNTRWSDCNKLIWNSKVIKRLKSELISTVSPIAGVYKIPQNNILKWQKILIVVFHFHSQSRKKNCVWRENIHPWSLTKCRLAACFICRHYELQCCVVTLVTALSPSKRCLQAVRSSCFLLQHKNLVMDRNITGGAAAVMLRHLQLPSEIFLLIFKIFLVSRQSLNLFTGSGARPPDWFVYPVSWIKSEKVLSIVHSG